MKNEETKRDKFVRIAEARTNKIINMIQLLGNCSNQSLYEYSQKDANKIAKKEVNLHLINNMEGIQHVSVEGKFSMDFF